MFYREIIGVYSEIHTKHIYTLCGQNVEFFFSIKPGGINYPVGFGTLWLPLGTVCRRDTVQTAKPVPSTRYSTTSNTVLPPTQTGCGRLQATVVADEFSMAPNPKEFVSSNLFQAT
jgi:hypothetical protein